MDESNDPKELIASYALGSLDAEETAAVEKLLAESHSARQELAQYQQVSDLLGLAVPAVEPSDSFEDRLFSRLGLEADHEPAAVAQPAAPRPQQVAEPKPSFWGQLSDLFARPAWQMAGGLAMVMLLFGSGFLMTQNRQMSNELAQIDGTLPTLQLFSSENLAATGMIVLSMDGINGTAIIDRMPVAPDGHEYQLWLLNGSDVEPGPTFSLNDVGYGARWVVSEQPLDSYERFAVTLEPSGGSIEPTTDPVLQGAFGDRR